MNRNYKGRNAFSRVFDLFKIKDPNSLYGPTLIRTSGTSPGNAPQKVVIHRSSSKQSRRR